MFLYCFFLEATFLLRFQVSCLFWDHSSLMGSRKLWICWLPEILVIFVIMVEAMHFSAFCILNRSPISLVCSRIRQNVWVEFQLSLECDFGVNLSSQIDLNHGQNHSYTQFVHSFIILMARVSHIFSCFGQLCINIWPKWNYL